MRTFLESDYIGIFIYCEDVFCSAVEINMVSAFYTGEGEYVGYAILFIQELIAVASRSLISLHFLLPACVWKFMVVSDGLMFVSSNELKKMLTVD